MGEDGAEQSGGAYWMQQGTIVGGWIEGSGVHNQAQVLCVQGMGKLGR